MVVTYRPAIAVFAKGSRQFFVHSQGALMKSSFLGYTNGTPDNCFWTFPELLLSKHTGRYAMEVLPEEISAS